MKPEQMVIGRSYMMFLMKNNTFIYLGKKEERYSFRIVNNKGEAIVPIEGTCSFFEEGLEFFEEKYHV